MPNATMWYFMSRVEREIIYFENEDKCYFICTALYCCCWAWAAAAAAARCCCTCWLTLSERRNIKICGSKMKLYRSILDWISIFGYLPGSCIIKWTQPSDCWTPRCRHSCSVNSRPFGTFFAISLGKITCRYSYIS
jgi:hypothetical protein